MYINVKPTINFQHFREHMVVKFYLIIRLVNFKHTKNAETEYFMSISSASMLQMNRRLICIIHMYMCIICMYIRSLSLPTLY